MDNHNFVIIYLLVYPQQRKAFGPLEEAKSGHFLPFITFFLQVQLTTTIDYHALTSIYIFIFIYIYVYLFIYLLYIYLYNIDT